MHYPGRPRRSTASRFEAVSPAPSPLGIADIEKRAARTEPGVEVLELYGPCPRGQRGTTGALATIGRVPTISRFFGIVITMYYAEHGVPHFHAERGEHSAVIAITPVEPLAGNLPKRDLRLVLAWAQLHEEELASNWERARRSETLAWIKPLQ